MKTRTRQSAGKRITNALNELAETLERGEPIAERFNVRTVELPPKPALYSAAKVRATRHRLGASQPVFASLVGVSTALVQHWEQGLRKPSRMACRLLDEMNRDPRRWSQLIKVRKTA